MSPCATEGEWRSHGIQVLFLKWEDCMQKTKQEIKAQIEEARKRYFSKGQKMAKLKPESSDSAIGVKPRQQRLGLFS